MFPNTLLRAVLLICYLIKVSVAHLISLSAPSLVPRVPPLAPQAQAQEPEKGGEEDLDGAPHGCGLKPRVAAKAGSSGGAAWGAVACSLQPLSRS